MPNKLLSVLMPIYNDESYLSETLDSIFCAVSKDNLHLVEFIFINDGSTDNTQQILDQYSQKFSFTCITRENRGLAKTTNELFNLATGRYIYIIDHDDLLEDKAIDTIIENILEHPDCDMLMYDYEDFYTEEPNKRVYNKKGWHNVPINGQDLFAASIIKNCGHTALWNKVIQRSSIIDNQMYFNEDLMFGDIEYYPRILSVLKNVVYINKSIYLWRQNRNSLSSTIYQNKSFGQLLLQTIESLLNFAKNTTSLNQQYIQALNLHLSGHYWAIFHYLKTSNGVNEGLIKGLEKYKYLMKYSKKWNRRYIYRPLISLLGIKRFCKLRSCNVF